MTLLTRPDSPLLLEVLRGDRARRPRRDDDTAAGLRAVLEDLVFDILGPGRRDSAVHISSSTLRGGSGVAPLADTSLSRVRGVVVSTALRLLVAHVHLDDPFDDALGAWRAERPGDPLLEQFLHFDEGQRARLRADVTAHLATLGTLGPVPSGWSPRTSQRAHQMLGGGNVHLSDLVDLVVGSINDEAANVALLDVTTSTLGEGAERVMRYHALMQTLRTSVVPLRTSMFSSATGELWALDVDGELLMRGVQDVATVLSAGATQ